MNATIDNEPALVRDEAFDYCTPCAALTTLSSPSSFSSLAVSEGQDRDATGSAATKEAPSERAPVFREEISLSANSSLGRPHIAANSISLSEYGGNSTRFELKPTGGCPAFALSASINTSRAFQGLGKTRNGRSGQPGVSHLGIQTEPDRVMKQWSPKHAPF